MKDAHLYILYICAVVCYLRVTLFFVYVKNKPCISVPDSKSRNIPEVVIVRRGQLGFWEFGEGGSVG